MALDAGLAAADPELRPYSMFDFRGTTHSAKSRRFGRMSLISRDTHGSLDAASVRLLD